MEEMERTRRFRRKAPKQTGKNGINTTDKVVRALFEIAIQRGLTLSDLSPIIGINMNTLSQWKQGRSFPSSANLNNFAEALGFRLDLKKINDV